MGGPGRARSSRPRSSSRVEAGLPTPAEEHFEGIPPEQIPPQQPLPESGAVPRARAGAGRCPARRRRGSAAEPSQAEPAAEEDPGCDGEYAPGEAPDAQGTEEKPVREVVIGAGPPPPTPPATSAHGAPAPHGKPPPDGDHEPAPKPKRYWWRFSLASVVIVAAIAAATASSILLYLNDIADALSQGGRLQKKLSPLLTSPSGGPQNILILGSDKRAGTPGDPGRSDTTILLRSTPTSRGSR